MNVLEVKQLSLAFRGKQQTLTAIDNASFVLKPAQTLALLGESGCGKSLTSLAIMRLLSEQSIYADNSVICFEQQNLLDIPEFLMQQLRGKRLAMVFQEPMTALNPVLTIQSQLSEAILQHESMSRPALQARMLQLLQDVEMPNPLVHLHQYPHQLSGGQKQRIVIAMALAHHPDVLIADEPTTALDVTIQIQILKLLQKLQRHYQMSLLLITHDLGVVKMMAQHVCVMYAGQVIESSDAAAFFDKPLHPYVQQLLVSVPSYAKRKERLQSIPGCVPQLDNMPSGCRFHPRCAHALAICAASAPHAQVIEERLVRCHLYPTHTVLPPLSGDRYTWQETNPSISKAILSVSHLSVQYEVVRHTLKHSQMITAVDDISFDLYEGKTLALVGESGCGKTSVSRAILQLLPMAGDIVYRNESVKTLRGSRLRQFRHKVQMVFQDPFSAMNPRMTIGDILAEGMLAQRMSSQKIIKKQKELLEQVGLSSQSLHRYPHQFSGGQRQRICIARALATEPDILVCDEPTSALDISIQAQILNLLKELQHEFGLSYLFITHNMSIVSYMADDVLVMRAGKMVEMGTHDAILQHPNHEYTRNLLASVL